MRTAITVGILKNGEAEIIHHPTVSMDKQRASFRDMGAAKKDSKYVEIRYIPSRGRSMSRRFTTAKGGVNHNAANRVADQGKKKTMVDFTPAEGKTGRVNFDASMKVADQGKAAKKSAARDDGDITKLGVAKLKELANSEEINISGASKKKDLVEAIELGRTLKASHTDSSLLQKFSIEQLKAIAENEQLDITGASKKQEFVDRISAGRDAKKSHTAGAKVEDAPKESAGGSNENSSSGDSGPTL